MNEHTQGNWTVERVAHPHGGTMNRIMAGDTPIAEPLQTGHDSDDSEANARLIAAAPDLLAALQEIADINDYDLLYNGTADMLRSIARIALAKVEA